MAEYSSTGTLLKRYVHGASVDDPLMWYEGTGFADPRWLMADHQGSVIAVSKPSSVFAANSYDPWGIPATTNIGRFQYTGHAWIPELGMYHYKARIYSPTLGRFLQTDPIGYEDQVNLYVYVGNNPVNAKDPSGLCASGLDRLHCTMISSDEDDKEKEEGEAPRTAADRVATIGQEGTGRRRRGCTRRGASARAQANAAA